MPVQPGAEPAGKLNLALAVTGRRDDGYHTLRSVFVRITLHDDLSVAPAVDPHAPDSLEVIGDPETPVQGNLVLRAAAQVRDDVAEPVPALHFRLTKRIPAAAGLAGGSSNASAALDLAAAAWGIRWHPSQRLATALKLGADVPFFSAGYAAALVQGIGEGLRPIAAPATPAGLVLVTPKQRLSTAAVFHELDRTHGRRSPTTTTGAGTADEAVGILVEALQGGLDGPGLAAVAPALRDANDLWAPASRLSPGLGAVRDALEASLGRTVLLTGSGPTLYAIYPSSRAAVEAADALERQRPSEIAGAIINASSTAGGEGS